MSRMSLPALCRWARVLPQPVKRKASQYCPPWKAFGAIFLSFYYYENAVLFQKLPLVQWQSLFITPSSFFFFFFFLVVASSHFHHSWTSFPRKEADCFWNPLKIKADRNFSYLRLPRWMSELSEMKSELPCKARSLWGVISIFTGRCPALVFLHPLFWGCFFFFLTLSDQ